MHPKTFTISKKKRQNAKELLTNATNLPFLKHEGHDAFQYETKMRIGASITKGLSRISRSKCP